jgi:hypothetical protein
MKSSLHRLTFNSELNSLPSHLNHLRLPSHETPSVRLLTGLGSSLYSLGTDSAENTVYIVIAQQYFDCCLRIRCLELKVYSLSAIPAFRRHVAVFLFDSDTAILWSEKWRLIPSEGGWNIHCRVWPITYTLWEWQDFHFHGLIRCHGVP